jgi:4-alpha-glucanotransferase
VEAWTEPHLFNLEAQAGAPPDDFAVKGQNWGFPTYNWNEMAKDGYSWWTKRMQKMADYFDTYRIDHILGFFRIWEVPSDAVEALLGHFNPALPLSVQEIESYSFGFDYDRMTKPYIPHYLVNTLFAESTNQVIQQFLEPIGEGRFRLKSEFDTQKKINQYFLNGIEEEDLDSQNRKIRNGLFVLVSNVLFVSTGDNEWHPRISMQKTSSFNDLDDWSKEQLNRLYLDYFYQRHEEFWYQKGMEKLPAIISVGNMLVCGEDLGMIPECVPKAMAELGILSLEIQRMPKNPKIRFAHPADAPYLSVCTTSTHDMSTIRGWWEEDREKTQLFYSQELGNQGLAPYYAEPWICQQIITQHLYSPAMWVTIPIQDFIAMDGQLRWEKTQLEQINDPSNVRHKWNYRMVQSIKDLKEAFIFNNLLKELIKASGRDSDY